MTIENYLRTKNHNLFSSKLRNGGKFTKLVFYSNQEIAGITDYEITKCGDPLYLECYTYMVLE